MSALVKKSQPTRPNRHWGKAHEAHRVAARLEGIVKNIGTRNVRKPKKKKESPSVEASAPSEEVSEKEV